MPTRSSGIWKVSIVLSTLALLAIAYAIGFRAGLYRSPPYGPTIRALRLVKGTDPADVYNWTATSTLYKELPVTSATTLIGDSTIRIGEWSVLMHPIDPDNRGISGETTLGVATRLDRGEPTAHTVVLVVGVNDVQEGLSLSETQRNLGHIIAMLRGKRLFVGSTLLTGWKRANVTVAKVIDIEQRVCRLPDCHFIDLNRGVSKDGILRQDMTADQVHLNLAGYKILAETIRKALVATS